MQQELTPGQRAILHEDGSQAEVEVLENKCVPGREAYRLRVIKILHDTDIGTQALSNGQEFDVDQPVGLKMWELKL